MATCSQEHFNVTSKTFHIKIIRNIISSVESQKGAITIQRCSFENQKGALTIDFVQ